MVGFSVSGIEHFTSIARELHSYVVVRALYAGLRVPLTHIN